jgi:hypothetical protein
VDSSAVCESIAFPGKRRLQNPKDRAGVTDKLSELLCGASSSKLVADSGKSLPGPSEGERKLLTGLVGRARIERATNWLQGSASLQRKPLTAMRIATLDCPILSSDLAT